MVGPLQKLTGEKGPPLLGPAVSGSGSGGGRSDISVDIGWSVACRRRVIHSLGYINKSPIHVNGASS
jgi:hypothetical protein